VRWVFSSTGNMLAKSTMQSPRLVGCCAEVALFRSVMALGAAPRRASFNQDACVSGEELSFLFISYRTRLSS
jgi:hypothetical protein